MKTADFQNTEKGILSLRKDRRRQLEIMARLEEKADEWKIELHDMTVEGFIEALEDLNVNAEEIAAIVWAVSECPESKVGYSASWVSHTINTF